MKRAALIKKINKLIPEAKAIPSEEWGRSKGAIYFRGSESYDSEGMPIFDYWNMGETFGVNPRLAKILDDAGWYGEALDAGTLMAFQ